MEDEGFLAMGLDSQRRQIRSIGSNPGHCLAAGIVDTSARARSADRLMEPRPLQRLGRAHAVLAKPALQPLQLSPRLGLAGRARQLRARLPALRPVRSAGPLGRARCSRRRASSTSTACPRSSAATRATPTTRSRRSTRGRTRRRRGRPPLLFSLLQAMLGLYPYAPLHMLLVDPHLPAWLPR